MATWLYPLSANEFKHADGTSHWRSQEDWCPPETALCVTRAGSMDRQIINHVVCHINKHARKTVRQDGNIVLLVDGHSSRK